MEIKVKPLIILNKGENSFRRPDGTREIIADEKKLAAKVTELKEALRANLEFGSDLLESAVVQDEDELEAVKEEICNADAVFLYLIGMPTFVRRFLQWGTPIIAFSGQYTPTLALYAFSVERQSYPDIHIATDFQDIDETLHLLGVRKKLQNTRVALFGFPPPVFSRWHHLPDFESAQQKLGVGFQAVEWRDLVNQLPTIDNSEAQRTADLWRQEAKEIIEPNESDILASAKMYLAVKKILAREKADAFGINCLEMMSESSIPAPCYALARLRDEGIPTACEVDIVALLTMICLGYICDKPTFMGNIVGAVPDDKIIRISHDVLPTKMKGFDLASDAFVLRNYHWKSGVTAYVDLDAGQEVMVARFSRELDKLMLINGELTGCTDTEACRNTLSVKIRDVKEFVRRAYGQHYVVVYGNQVSRVKAFCEDLNIDCVVL